LFYTVCVLFLNANTPVNAKAPDGPNASKHLALGDTPTPASSNPLLDGPNVPKILVLGDSLSAAHGMEPQAGWVNLLQKRLSTRYFRAKIINASIGGETTEGGLARIGSLLSKHNPDIVILELGGNDGLRGLPLSLMEDNLERIIKIILPRKTKIVLIGMQLPPNYGKFYTQQFQQTYKNLAEKYQLTLVPFLMKGFANNPKYMQKDGIHPKENAQSLMLDTVWPYVRPLIPRAALK